MKPVDADKLSSFLDQVVMSLLHKNEKFANHVATVFPALYADIMAYRQNSKCSCRRRIGKALFGDESRQATLALTKAWMDSNEHDVDLDQLHKQAEQSVAMGKVISVAKTPEAYKVVIDQAIREGWMFRGISVVEQPDAWILFFY